MTTRKTKQAAPQINEKQFKFRGRDCVIKLISPAATDKRLPISGEGIGYLWDLSPLGKTELKDLKEPVAVMGQYLPATFEVTGLGFESFNFSIKLNDKRNAIVIDEITIKGDSGLVEAVLPLDRLRIYNSQASTGSRTRLTMSRTLALGNEHTTRTVQLCQFVTGFSCQRRTPHN